MSIKAAECICCLANLRIRQSGWCSLVLSGGTTPGPLYERLATAEYADRIPWSRVHVFWGDERCVSPRSTKSNFRLANTALLSRVAIPQRNVHRIRTEHVPAQEAASQYDEEIRAVFRARGVAGLPAFDIVLLGLGLDGHTASLFPNDAALKEHERLVVAVQAPAGQQPLQRISLTLKVFNSASHGLFLVSGRQKTEMISRIMGKDQGRTSLWPAAMVRCRKQTLWFVSEG